jgi:hypothetical protein
MLEVIRSRLVAAFYWSSIGWLRFSPRLHKLSFPLPAGQWSTSDEKLTHVIPDLSTVFAVRVCNPDTSGRQRTSGIIDFIRLS